MFIYDIRYIYYTELYSHNKVSGMPFLNQVMSLLTDNCFSHRYLPIVTAVGNANGKTVPYNQNVWTLETDKDRLPTNDAGFRLLLILVVIVFDYSDDCIVVLSLLVTCVT